MPDMFLYRLHLYGRFRLCDVATGAEMRLRGRKARGVLAYLALAADHRADREQLIGLLWGERGESQARASLRQTVLELREIARATPVLAVSRLDLSLDTRLVDIDVEAPSRDVARGDLAALPGSLGPARDRLLSDLDDLDPSFDEWLCAERERQQTTLVALGLEAIETANAEGQPGIAARIATALADIDDTQEAVTQAGMCAFHRTGDHAGARRCYARLAAALHRDLNLQPSPETVALRDKLFAEPCAVSPGIEAGLGTPPPAAVEDRSRPPPTPARRRWWLWLVGAAVVLAGGSMLYLPRTPTAPAPVVAVLPFQAVGGTDAAYADTIWDGTTTDLGGYGGIRIVGRRSALALAGVGDASEIGRRLGATYLVEGSVQQDGARLLVSVGLVRTSDSIRVATLATSGRADDIATLQHRIGSIIATRLRGSSRTHAPAHVPPVEAYSLYMLSRGMIRSRDATQVQAAIPLLTRAVVSDPHFAAGWSNLAKATWLSWELSHGSVPEDESFASAMGFARKAVALAPDESDAHAVLGMLMIGVDQPTALANLRRATELDGGNVEAWFWLGNAELMDARYAAALAAYRAAVAIDPLWSRTAAAVAVLAYELGDRKEAALHLARTALGPDRSVAICIAARFAGSDGDHATMLARGLAARAANPTDTAEADEVIRDALMALGRPREAAAFAVVDPLEQQIMADGLPGSAALRAHFVHARDFWRATSDYIEIEARLVAAGRDADLVDLYRRGFGEPDRMRHAPEAWFSAPSFVAAALPIVLALRRSGDASDAARLLGAARAAAAPIIASPAAPPSDSAAAAGVLAQSGDIDGGTTMLVRAYDRGWRPRLALTDDAVLAPLRVDPRFTVLAARAADARRQQSARAARINLTT